MSARERNDQLAQAIWMGVSLLLSRSHIEDRFLRAACSGVTTNDEVATNNASLDKVSSLLIPGKGSDRLRGRMAQ